MWLSRDAAASEPAWVCGATAGPEMGEGDRPLLRTRALFCPRDEPPSLPSDATKFRSVPTPLCVTHFTHLTHVADHSGALPSRRPRRFPCDADPAPQPQLAVPEHNIWVPENLGEGAMGRQPGGLEGLRGQLPGLLTLSPTWSPVPEGTESRGGEVQTPRAAESGFFCAQQSRSTGSELGRLAMHSSRPGHLELLWAPNLAGQEPFPCLPAKRIAHSQPSFSPGASGPDPGNAVRGRGGETPSLRAPRVCDSSWHSSPPGPDTASHGSRLTPSSLSTLSPGAEAPLGLEPPAAVPEGSWAPDLRGCSAGRRAVVRARRPLPASSAQGG